MTRPFLVQRLRATFEGEPGEGIGVTRAFIVAFCDAFIRGDLPSAPGLPLMFPYYIMRIEI